MTDRPDPAPSARPSMAKAVTLATLGVLLFGALVGGGLYWSLHRFGTRSTCPPARPAAAPVAEQIAPKGPEIRGHGWMVVGDTAALVSETAGSAFYLTMGGRCEYWLVVRKNTLYAYKARLPDSSCAVIWNQPRHSFICNATKAEVPLSELPRWPAREITSGPNKGSFEMNFD